MKILVAVPTFENICPEVFKAIYDLDPANHKLDFTFVKGYDCAKARNEIAKKAVGYDYVLMVDSDTIVPKETIRWMLEEPVDICLGVCPRKNTKTEQTTLYKLGQYNFNDEYKYSELTDDRIVIKGGGFACAMVRVEVFERLPYPWFQYVSYTNGSFLSEDFYFCCQAEKYGITIWADTRVRCGHLARYFQYK